MADGLIATAESTQNPHSLSQALLAIGLAFRDTDPPSAMEALGRALEDRPGQRQPIQRIARRGCAVSSLKHCTVPQKPRSTTSRWRSATTSIRATSRTSRSPLAILAALLDRLGHYEPAATIADFAANPVARMAFPEITTTIAHLREVLGDDRYESLAQAGQAMTNAAMATYAFEQIDLARAQLSDPTTPT